MAFLLLTTSDEPNITFYVRPDRITAMYRHNNYTMIHYDAATGSACWCVKETPEQIMSMLPYLTEWEK